MIIECTAIELFRVQKAIGKELHHFVDMLRAILDPADGSEKFSYVEAHVPILSCSVGCGKPFIRCFFLVLL
jgi:hypothetical protein